MSELDCKPCPFCGCTDIRFYYDRMPTWNQMYCYKCKSRGAKKMGDMLFAVEAWNTRSNAVVALPSASDNKSSPKLPQDIFDETVNEMVLWLKKYDLSDIRDMDIVKQTLSIVGGKIGR